MTNSEKTALSRRTFVKGSALAGLGAAAVGTTSLFGCAPQGTGSGDAELAETGDTAPVDEKICWGHCAVNCECRCALRFHVVDDEVAWVETDNTGDDTYGDHQLRACQRGRSIRRWINHPDRLTVPLKRVGKRGEGKFEEISWDEALDTIAESYKKVLDEYGPEAVLVQYATGVQDSNIRNFVKRLACINGGFLKTYGSYSSAQIGQALPWLYGGREANGTSDVANSKLVVLFGDNSCETKMSGGGPTYHYMMGLEKSGAKVIVIDPRYTDTAAVHADQWIPVRPGTDAALVDACAYVMITEDLVDHDFLSKYCVGYDDATMPEELRGQGKSYVDYITGKGADKTAKTPEWASAITLVPAATIEALAREIAAAKPCAIYQGKGPQRRGNGEQTARAICMLAILTGNVGINGGNTGSDLDSYYMPADYGIPMPDNGVETSIGVFTWIDAVDRGTEMTATRDGVRGRDALAVPVKFIFNYGGNCLTNQHHDINRTHDILADESKCEFIVVWDTFLTDSAKYADILLPDLMAVEQPNIVQSEYAGNMAYTIAGTAITSPKFERRTLYSTLADIAERLGQRDEFTEGLDEMGWLERLYEQGREGDPDQPSFEAMLEQGIYRKQCPEGEHVAFREFRDDPEANPLETPSGKIEIYSAALEEEVANWELDDDQFISPLPVYCPESEGYADPLSEKYPLQLTGFHFKGRCHSSYGNIEVLKKANPGELWMNPLDAADRNLADGDTVQVFNDRGTVEIVVKVTPRIIPGTVAMGQGAWHDADMAGDKIDRGGCINTLTAYKPSPYAKANPSHTNLVEVVKA